MKRSRQQSGFTILETLIVLAVSAAMFLMAAVVINGQQSRTAFSQSVRDIQSVIQQNIAQVGAGNYPNLGGFSCNGTGGTLIIQPGTNNQGANTGCIFLGKVMQFGVSGTDPQEYRTYTVAGLRQNGGSIVTAAPRAIAPGASTNNTLNFPDASVKSTLHNGLTAVSMNYVVGASRTPIGAVAFISSLGQYSGSDLISGSQNISLMPVVGSTSGTPWSTSSPAVVDAINNNLKTSPVNPSGGVEICFASGGSRQSGLVTIGSNGRELSVTLAIKTSKDCT